MNKIFTIIVSLAFLQSATAQQVPCRPRIAMFNYHFHNDNSPNSDMSTIKAALPELLIDNTPHGYWGEQNGYVGCKPSEYIPLGIQVYSYIAGGYEGSKYKNNIDSLSINLARISGIKADGATGVFLDEVSDFPTTAQKNYISAIATKCKQEGLKLILNTGIQYFDSWLMTQCDYILTDEKYKGTRQPTISEQPFLDRVIVISENITSDTAAAKLSIGARANGFGYSYGCVEYINIPTWLNSYLAMIAQKPATPTISWVSGKISSSASYGVQWFYNGTLISGANSKNYSPTQTGFYTSVTTFDGCSSDTSNKIYYAATDVNNVISNENNISIYPNPARNQFFIQYKKYHANGRVNISVFNTLGNKVLEKSIDIDSDTIVIDVSNLNQGIYIVQINDGAGVISQKLSISNK